MLSGLDGGVADGSVWQTRWHELTIMPSHWYDAPGGKAGQRFVRTLSREITDVRESYWNGECFIVFQTVILQHAVTSHVRRKSGGASWRGWMPGTWGNTRCWWRKPNAPENSTSLPPGRRNWRSSEQWLSQLLSCVGKMWIAVRWIMEQEKGGITASWPLFKDGVSCARCDSIGASQRASSIIHDTGMLSGSSSGDGLAGLDVGHHIWGGTENFQRGRTGRDGLGDTTELDLVIWGGQRTPMGDCWFLHGVARKSPSILGRVYGHNGREVNWNQ